MDALDLLIADHNRVRGLFARFKEAEEAERTDDLALLAAKVHQELEVHTAIEEEIFYPWVKGLEDEVADLVNEGIEEHHVVDTLMAEVRGLEPGDDQWVAKMTVLIENVEHHADEEESEMFPKVRSATEAEARVEVGARLDARKGELGAPTLAATVDLTKAELDELARDQQIPGRSSMDRDELAATVDPR